MPLQPNDVTIPLHGLDTHADPKNAPPGTLDLVENMYFKRSAAGGGELRKRFGVTARTKNVIGGTTLATGRKLASYNNEQLIATDPLLDNNGVGYGLATWDAAQGQWQPRGNASFVEVGVEPIVTSPVFNGYLADVAISGNLLCAVTADAHVTVVNLTTGERLVNNVAFGASPSTMTHVVALASSFILFSGIATGNIVANKIDYATPTVIGGNVNAVTDGHAGQRTWDVVRNGSNDSVMICYRTNVPQIKTLIWNSNMTAGANATGGDDPQQAIGFVLWDASNGSLYVTYVSATAGWKTTTIATANAAQSAATVLDAGITAARNVTGYRTGTTNICFAEVLGSPTYNTLIRRHNGAAQTVWVRSLGIAAKPFLQGGSFAVGGRFWLPCTYDDNVNVAPIPVQSGYFVLDATAGGGNIPPPCIAKGLDGLGGGLTSSFNLLGQCPAIDGVTQAVPASMFLTTLPVGRMQAPSYLTLKFGSSNISPYKRLGDSLYMGGGVPRNYDGSSSSSEAGFYLFPEQPTLAQVAGGALTATGVYQYQVLYVWIDGRGQRHESAPSSPISITLTAGNTRVNLTVPTLRLHEKPAAAGVVSNVFIEVYRTVNAGATFFRLPIATTFNDVTVDTIAMVDTFADVVLSALLELYTTGGALAHVPLPPATLMEVWRNRVFLAGTEFPLELWVSDEFVTGAGIGLSDQNIIAIEAEGGRMTALAEMDDRLVIFKEQSIYTLQGLGPARNGEGQYEQPARLSAVVGAVSQAGVTKTPQGLIFKSLRGFYLLPIGGGLPIRLRGVETFESLTVTSGIVMDDLEQVRFMTSAGTTLVYHFGFLDEQGLGRWTTFTGQAAVDCALFSGTFCYLASDGTLQLENAAYNDNAAPITAKARFAWLNLSGIYGDVRLWAARPLVDVDPTPSGFTIQIFMEVDFAAGIVQTAAIAVVLTGSPPIELRPGRQDANAYRLTIQEASQSVGFTLSALVLELGALGRLKPVAATQRMT